MITAAALNTQLTGSDSPQHLLDALQTTTWDIEVLATGKQYNAMVALIGRKPRHGGTVYSSSDKGARAIAKAVARGYIEILDSAVESDL